MSCAVCLKIPACAGFSDLERSLGIATERALKGVWRDVGFSDLERSLGIATGLLAGNAEARRSGFSDLERSLGIAT